jgi:hypothetical protein
LAVQVVAPGTVPVTRIVNPTESFTGSPSRTLLSSTARTVTVVGASKGFAFVAIHDIPDGTLFTDTVFTVSSVGTETLMQPISPPPPPGLSLRALKTTEVGVRAAIVAGDRVRVQALSRARTAEAATTASATARAMLPDRRRHAPRRRPVIRPRG